MPGGVEGEVSEEGVSGENVGLVSVDDGGDWDAGVDLSDGDPPGSGPDAPVDGDSAGGDPFWGGEGPVDGSGYGVGLVDVGGGGSF